MEEKEIINKLKSCKTVDELKTVAKEIGYELTDEEAQSYFEKLSMIGELSDDELGSVSGGGCVRWRRGRAYSGVYPHYLIVTVGNSCSLFGHSKLTKGTCSQCCHHSTMRGAMICSLRTWDHDKLNPR